MNMRNKHEIIEAIRQTAIDNGGMPLGQVRFEKETGIKPHEWGKHWARFGDAQKEAGFIPNQRQRAYANEFLIEKMIGIIRKMFKFPTWREIEVERSNDKELPTIKAFSRLGKTEQLAEKIIQYCNGRDDYHDVIELCRPVIEKTKGDKSVGSDINQEIGEVYLFKSGRYYKIGKTSCTVRRGSELRIQLPEKITLIHSINTDDPNGIEAYWHKRFELKRKNGEWFDLNSNDVKAFKRWRRIV